MTDRTRDFLKLPRVGDIDITRIASVVDGKVTEEAVAVVSPDEVAALLRVGERLVVVLPAGVDEFAITFWMGNADYTCEVEEVDGPWVCRKWSDTMLEKRSEAPTFAEAIAAALKEASDD